MLEMRSFVCKLLVVLGFIFGMNVPLYASISGEQFDATVFCIVGVEDYCDTLEIIDDEELRFYSDGDFFMKEFPGHVGGGKDEYYYVGPLVYATVSEMPDSYEKLTAYLFGYNVLDIYMYGFIVLAMYKGHQDYWEDWPLDHMGFALFWAEIDD